MNSIAAGPSNTSIIPTTSKLTAGNTCDHMQARWAIRRGQHRVKAGLYALGSPTSDTAVFVTGNYSLSFDALRSALVGKDAYLLVLETDGINVWCAAGKGTFSTEELVNRIAMTQLGNVVRHRTLILPQLGATGIAAHEVKQRSSFRVEYGPIRAEDLAEYLKMHQASQAMRIARFNWKDRVTLIPVELMHTLLPMFAAGIAVYFLAGLLPALATIAALLGGVALFPLLLPWIPSKDFSSKGYVLGFVIALAFSLAILFSALPVSGWLKWGNALGLLLALPVVTSYLALNFTGSTPFASRTGVKREIYRYILLMAGLFGGGLLVLLAVNAAHLLGRL